MTPEALVVDQLRFLLEFFAKSQQDQWREIPTLDHPVLVRGTDFEFATKMPLRVAAAVLVLLLRETTASSATTAEVLEEMRVLVYPWMMESTRLEIFSKREEPEEADVIWRTLSRLCRLALNDPQFSGLVPSAVTLAELVEEYSAPLNPEEWAQFPIR